MFFILFFGFDILAFGGALGVESPMEGVIRTTFTLMFVYAYVMLRLDVGVTFTCTSVHVRLSVRLRYVYVYVYAYRRFREREREMIPKLQVRRWNRDLAIRMYLTVYVFIHRVVYISSG